MPYHNLPLTLAQIESNGFTDIAEELLSELSKQVIVAYEYTVSFSDWRRTKRLRRLLYELLYFHPQQKSRCSFQLNGETLIIKIRDKEERRGRRPR